MVEIIDNFNLEESPEAFRPQGEPVESAKVTELTDLAKRVYGLENPTISALSEMQIKNLTYVGSYDLATSIDFLGGQQSITSKDFCRKSNTYPGRPWEMYYHAKGLYPKPTDLLNAASSKAEISILDIGGGDGKMLSTEFPSEHNGVKVRKNIATVNPPQDNYESVEVHYNYVEALPKEFTEKFDIVISNYASRYFVYPDLALLNSILCLKPNGICVIDTEPYNTVLFTTQNVEEQSSRIARMQKLYDQLIEKGYLEPLSSEQVQFEVNKLVPLHFKKLRSISKEEIEQILGVDEFSNQKFIPDKNLQYLYKPDFDRIVTQSIF